MKSVKVYEFETYVTINVSEDMKRKVLHAVNRHHGSRRKKDKALTHRCRNHAANN